MAVISTILLAAILMYAIWMLEVFSHEAAHAWVALAVGYHVKQIEVGYPLKSLPGIVLDGVIPTTLNYLPGGAVTLSIADDEYRAWKTIVVSLAGPFMSLLYLVGVLWVFAGVPETNMPLAVALLSASIAIAGNLMLNLFAEDSDGHHAFKTFQAMRAEAKKVLM